MSLSGFFATWLLEASFEGRAQLVQFVRMNPDGLRAGSQGYVTLGAPQKVILDAPGAFLPGYASPGVRLADVDWLKRKSLSPLHLGSVQLIAWYARVGCLLSMAISVVGLVVLQRSQLQDAN